MAYKFGVGQTDKIACGTGVPQSTNRTLYVRFRLHSSNATIRDLVRFADGGYYHAFLGFAFGTQQITWGFRADDLSYPTLTWSTGFGTAQTHVLIGTYDGTDLKIYADDDATAKATQSSGLAPHTDAFQQFWIGNDPLGPTQSADATIFEVGWWTSVLTQTERLELAAGVSPLDIATAPAGYWPLTSDASDASANNNDGTVTGAQFVPHGMGEFQGNAFQVDAFQVSIVGTASVTLSAPTVGATGSVSGGGVTGTSGIVLSAPVVAATGTLTIPGTAAVTLSAPVVASSGIVANPVSGTSAITLSAPVVAAAGTETITGSAAITLSAPIVSASGLETISGTSGVVLSAPTVSSTGTETITGTSAVVLIAPVVAATGLETITGSSGVVLSAPTVAATGTAFTGVSGTAAITLSAPSVAASGTALNPVTGTSAVVLSPPSVAASGHIFGGAASVALSAPVVAAVGDVEGPPDSTVYTPGVVPGYVRTALRPLPGVAR